jgi:pyruvate dehydrogenase E1 component alpha subunit
MTYRHRGHFEGDATGYRVLKEVEEWKQRDPIPRFRQQLIKMGVLSEAEASGIEESCRQQVSDAIKFAEDSPWPRPEETLEDVYVSYR